jgi:predicted amidohydrolase YtcJ
MESADRIFVGGTIRPVSTPLAEAVAVRDGMVVAVGDERDVLALRTQRTDIVELGTSTLLPGLIEPHSHPDLSGQLYSWVDVSGFTHQSVTGVEAAIRDAGATTADGEWIFCFGLDAMLTPDIGVWSRDRLDALSPDNPTVVLIQSMHTLFANSAALSLAGITDDTPDPPGGGSYEHDQSGRLTGRVEEMTALLPFVVFGLPTREEAMQQIAQEYQRYRSVGITTVGMAGAFLPADQFDIYPELAADPDTPVRLAAYLRHTEVGTSPWGPGQGSDRFRVQGVKLWYDGSPYTGTMLLDDPYLETNLCCCTLGITAGSTGRANFEPGEFVEFLSDLAADGWQVLTHAQGDRACRETVDLYAQALHNAGSDHRWRLEHCALIESDELDRIGALGVSPSFHIDHVRYYGPELRDSIIGPQRADRLMPIADALERELKVSLHADSPMYPAGPLRLMATAVTRKARTGDRIGAAQAITPEQALRAVTLDAAWQLGLDHEIGSLEVGKRADFTILGGDPLAIEPDEMEDLRIESTWLDGEPQS